MDKTLEEIAKTHEVEAYMLDAANNYLLMTLKFLQITQFKFNFNVTRLAMELQDMVEQGTVATEVWKKYIELLKATKAEGMDLSEVPLRSFGMAI